VTHQLVFQFESITVQDYDRLIALSEKIGEALPHGAILDGHDVGLGEFNIFIHTKRPKAHFGPIREIIAKVHPELAFAAGYRALEDDEYLVLWPPSSTKFSVA